MTNTNLKELYDHDACINVLLNYISSLDQCANVMNELEKIIFNQNGRNCCNGDEALVYKDNEDCAFVDSHGEVMVVVNDKTMRFIVKRCPNCGRVF